MVLECDLLILGSLCSDSQSSHPQKREKKLIVIGFSVFLVSWSTKMGLNLVPNPLNHKNYYLKILLTTVCISWPNFITITSRSMIQKIFSKMCFTSSTNHDVTDFKVDGKFRNINIKN